MSVDGSALGYPELLRLAQAKDLQELDVAIVQVPSEANGGHAVVVATARTSRILFRAIGEAWRDSLPVNQRMQTLLVAEQRAKTRALCEAVGLPQVLEAATAGPVPAVAGSKPQPAATPGTVTAPRRAEPDGDSTQTSHTDEPAEPQEESSQDVSQHAGHRPSTSRAGQRPPIIPTAEGLDPGTLQRLIQMTRRKAELEGKDSSEPEAMRKLESFFQRAFGHALEEGTRVEGQRVLQRLSGELANLSASGEGHDRRVAG